MLKIIKKIILFSFKIYKLYYNKIQNLFNIKKKFSIIYLLYILSLIFQVVILVFFIFNNCFN